MFCTAAPGPARNKDDLAGVASILQLWDYQVGACWGWDYVSLNLVKNSMNIQWGF